MVYYKPWVGLPDESDDLDTGPRVYDVDGVVDYDGGVYEMRSGREYRGLHAEDEERVSDFERDSADESPDLHSSDNPLIFIKFVGRIGEQVTALEALGAKTSVRKMQRSDHILHYIDYIPAQKALVLEHFVWRGISTAYHVPDADILNIAHEMLEALIWLHDHGLVHGDVRPRCILPPASVPSARGHKLFCHGIVPYVESSPTIPGPEYTAPELRARPYKPTPASDVWMLGMMLWRCHRGDEAKVSSLCAQRLEDTAFIGMNNMDDGCKGWEHPVLTVLISRMVKKDPRERCTAREAWAYLEGEVRPQDDPNTQLSKARDAAKQLGGLSKRDWTTGLASATQGVRKTVYGVIGKAAWVMEKALRKRKGYKALAQD
ncbi:Serine/threonine-protein kinase 17A [Colletotrichum sidae]|uniref:Serine/threonine-protein kinase 17A n=1 Tax=Colletotrichum sidae TaxID=1347389 RepID=A0A4R8TAA9_9PEZI|nr:Serine/threonine-protein kinase 17A [Colletotrichum sidae]